MGTVVAERVDRPLSLFDEFEALAPVPVPERERAIPEKAEPAAPAMGEPTRGGAVAQESAAAAGSVAAPGDAAVWEDVAALEGAPGLGGAAVWEDVAAQDGAIEPDGEAAHGGAVQVHDGVGGEPTLDELIVGAWEGLTAQAAVACPLCDAGELRPVYADAGGASPPVAGRCATCGTTLS
jgi:hypothetical protein